MAMASGNHGGNQRGGITLIEIAVSTVLIVILLSILVPALQRARVISYREQCASNLRNLGVGLSAYLADHDGEFPFVPIQPGWHYGGLRHSAATGASFLDQTRPLNRWLSPYRVSGEAVHYFCCPADRGIEAEDGAIGTAGRTACRVYGTSYRANAPLFDARLAGLTEALRGARRAEITAGPSRLLVLGDPVWYETARETGLDADWHDQPNTGNILFLDGSVRFQGLRPGAEGGPVVIDLNPPGTVFEPSPAPTPQ